MMLREIFVDLRTNGAIVVVKVVVIVLVGLGVYNVHAFSENTDAAIDRSFSSQAGVNMYELRDELFEPEAFANYRSSPERVEGVARFYDSLNRDSRINFLSAFNQSVPVLNFRGNETFNHHYGQEPGAQRGYTDEAGRTWTTVKSMQMNRKTFDFYKLGAAKGAVIDWNKVDYSSGRIPVMLGDSYRGIYDIGSTFTGNFYFRHFTFEVVGFLPKGAAMYYEGEVNHYLDKYVVIPYPPRLEGCTALDNEFCGALAFATINTNFATPKDMSTQEVLNRLDAIGSATGFKQYGVNGIPTYVTQLSLMRKLIENNSGLLQILQALVVALTGFVLFVVNRHLAGRRAKKAQVWQLMGASRAAAGRMLWRLRGVEYALAGTLLLVALMHMPQQNPFSLVVAMGALAGAAVFEVATSSGGRDDLAQ